MEIERMLMYDRCMVGLKKKKKKDHQFICEFKVRYHLSSRESLDQADTSEHILKYIDCCIEKVSPKKVVQL